MDIMLLGETIQSDPANPDHHGFWMPAGGNDGVAAIEVFRISTTSTVYTVTLQTKKSDEPDSAAVSAGSASITATGITRFDAANAKDLVRYKVRYSLEDSSASMHLQLCQPLWSPN